MCEQSTPEEPVLAHDEAVVLELRHDLAQCTASQHKLAGLLHERTALVVRQPGGAVLPRGQRGGVQLPQQPRHLQEGGRMGAHEHDICTTKGGAGDAWGRMGAHVEMDLVPGRGRSRCRLAVEGVEGSQTLKSPQKWTDHR